MGLVLQVLQVIERKKWFIVEDNKYDPTCCGAICLTKGSQHVIWDDLRTNANVSALSDDC